MEGGREERCNEGGRKEGRERGRDRKKEVKGSYIIIQNK